MSYVFIYCEFKRESRFLYKNIYGVLDGEFLNDNKI